MAGWKLGEGFINHGRSRRARRKNGGIERVGLRERGAEKSEQGG